MSPRRDFVSRRRRRWEVRLGRRRRVRPTTRRRLGGRRRRRRRLHKRPRRLRWLRRRRSRLRPNRRSRSDEAFRLATVERLSSVRCALLSRPLPALTRYTILPPIKHGGATDSTALRRLPGEVIEGVGEVLQARQLADSGWHHPGEAVVGYIQLLQAPHAADLRRQRPLQIVKTHIKHRQVLQHPNLRRQAPRQIIIHQNQLVQSLPHLPNAGRNAAAEIVVRQNQHRNRRVPQILRYAESESVVVEEQSIQILVKHLRRHATLEVIEPEVQELQRRQRQHHLRKPTNKAVVAQIQLEKQLQFLEAVRNDAAESVRVDVEEREVGEQTQFIRQVSGNVAVVEIDTRHHSHGGVRQSGGAENAAVGADIRPRPVRSEVERIGENGLLPRLQGEVGSPETRVLEGQILGVANDVFEVDVVLSGSRIGDLGGYEGDNESCEEQAPP